MGDRGRQDGRCVRGGVWDRERQDGGCGCVMYGIGRGRMVGVGVRGEVWDKGRRGGDSTYLTSREHSLHN